MIAALRTQRLRLLPLAFPQLELCLINLPALEEELGLSISRNVFTERVRAAIHKKIGKMENPASRRLREKLGVCLLAEEPGSTSWECAR